MKCSTCGEMNCMAHGGEAQPMDADGDHDGDSMDSELLDMCSDEFFEAAEKKDKKGMLDALRAMVLSCKE